MGHFNDDCCKCPFCLIKKVLKDNDIELDYILVIPNPGDIEDSLVAGTIPSEEAYIRLNQAKKHIFDKLIAEGRIEAKKATTH